ncbi:HIT family protein [Candidatus Woesearchaeota archaeon]|nr:HIT family protein [Candidatus Woesearchaeota archaeon]
MADCKYCEEIEFKVYEDEEMICFLDQNPVSVGHLVIIPRNHNVIIEQISDDVFPSLFIMANKLSAILFDVIGAQGTNILINNGISAGQEIPHSSINIIPRKPEDGLSFEWNPKPAQKEDLESLSKQIIDALNKKEEPSNPEEKEKKPSEIKKDEAGMNWVEKALHRLP